MIIKFNDEKVKVGTKVIWTTSELPYNNLKGTFVTFQELTHYADVDVEYIGEDYSEYDPRTCRNGGNYGYDYYVVTKIHEVGEL